MLINQSIKNSSFICIKTGTILALHHQVISQLQNLKHTINTLEQRPSLSVSNRDKLPQIERTRDGFASGEERERCVGDRERELEMGLCRRARDGD